MNTARRAMARPDAAEEHQPALVLRAQRRTRAAPRRRRGCRARATSRSGSPPGTRPPRRRRRRATSGRERRDRRRPAIDHTTAERIEGTPRSAASQVNRERDDDENGECATRRASQAPSSDRLEGFAHPSPADAPGPVGGPCDERAVSAGLVPLRTARLARAKGPSVNPRRRDVAAAAPTLCAPSPLRGCPWRWSSADQGYEYCLGATAFAYGGDLPRRFVALPTSDSVPVGLSRSLCVASR